ncbi:AAA family ATPase [Sphingomonas bacterium]|uniref:AAA family ATPase n=1 Tax=Sphingomonas bacterium TaxID=1895847 RepID=UPI001575EB65|nr:AAA family ATPase [Sphingomonas bacterium]
MSAATVHLICGSTGAGKTTYAIRLADELGALRFSIDEWMTALFWMDSPQPIDPEWAIARVERAGAMIWRIAVDAAHRGVPSVLEVGLTTRQARTRSAERAAAEGLAVRLHFLDVLPDERWGRVAERNTRLGEETQLGFAITREMFDFVEAMWEAPDADEMAAMNGVRVSY